MSKIQKFSYQGFEIQFEEVNGQLMANATAMCQAFGKRPVDWLKLESTKRYFDAVKAKWEFVTLVEARQGGSEAGTWVHEKMILKLAQWLSVDFELWCDEKVAELLRTGKAELKPLTPLEIMAQSVQLLMEQDKRLNSLETQVKEIAAKGITHEVNYFTVAGYGSLIGVKVDLAMAAKIGRAASKICNDGGFQTGKVLDPRFGSVKTYPKDVLELAFR